MEYIIIMKSKTRKIRKRGAIKYIAAFNEIDNQLAGWPDSNETVVLLCKASMAVDLLMDRFKLDPALIKAKKPSSVSKNKCLINIINAVKNGDFS